MDPQADVDRDVNIILDSGEEVPYALPAADVPQLRFAACAIRKILEFRLDGIVVETRVTNNGANIDIILQCNGYMQAVECKLITLSKRGGALPELTEANLEQLQTQFTAIRHSGITGENSNRYYVLQAGEFGCTGQSYSSLG